jgi:LysM repeat protein
VGIAVTVTGSNMLVPAATTSAGAVGHDNAARHDTLFEIAQRFGLSVSLLARARHPRTPHPGAPPGAAHGPEARRVH